MKTNLYWCEQDMLVFECTTPEGAMLFSEYRGSGRDLLPTPSESADRSEVHRSLFRRRFNDALASPVTYPEKDDVLRVRRELLFEGLAEAREWARLRGQKFCFDTIHPEPCRAEHFAALMSHLSPWDVMVGTVRMLSVAVPLTNKRSGRRDTAVADAATVATLDEESGL